MADPIYVGDIGTEITVDCGQEITGATNTKLVVQTPLGGTEEWTAVVVSVGGKTQYLRYTTKAGDIAIPGVYRLQSYLTLGSWTGSGKTAQIAVKDRFE